MRRIQYLPTQNAGRNSLNLLEDTVKVKLIGKTDLRRNVFQPLSDRFLEYSKDFAWRIRC